MKKPIKSVRLVSHVIPERYQLALKPDLDAFVFEGEETITLKLDKKIKEITLHSVDLDIESAVIMQNKEKTFATKIFYNKKAETATFVFPKSLEVGKAKLILVFRGILNDTLRGFYRSRYEVNGKDYYMATTQFEATDARRAFPCFDEPAAKAVFDIKLIVPKKKMALSNTIPISIREHSAGYQVVEFSSTPKMSTYLVAFIVGDLEYMERKTREGILVRVFTTPGKKHQAEFALDCATKILSFFGEYFDIPYPMPVLDMVAIPDFSSAAMENWGAVTYREAALLVDPDNSSAAAKQRIAIVIAHELSHQWFGNLVTMEWWTHLWLNEGFATYIEYLAVDHIFPEWNMWTEFVADDLDAALTADSLKHTHPIEVEVHHPDDIAEIFDPAISYAKGASVIRMLAEYLGEEDFRDGLRFYLKKHSYKNTVTADLWCAFEKVSKKRVSGMMGVWTGKGGYPLITVSRKNGELSIKQSRFLSSPISKKSTKDKTIWHIPINFKNGGTTSIEKFLLTVKETKIFSKNETWIKLNTGEAGVFRVSYSPELWVSLATAVREGELAAVDRLGLVRDVFDLAYSGELGAVQALDFISAFRDETNYAVWGEIVSGLNRVYRIVFDDSCAQTYKDFVLDILNPMIKIVGWDKKTGEKHTDTLLRELILSTAGAFGDPKIVAKAQKMFRAVKVDENTIPPDLRNVVYCTVARNGGPLEYNKLLNLYKKTDLHEEKNRIGSALGYFKDKNLLQKTLEFSISEDVRSQDTMRFTARITMNLFAGDLAWKFLKKHWAFLLERYGGQKDLAYFIDPLGSYSSDKISGDIEKFFKKNSAPAAERSVEQVLESVRAKALWLSRDKKKIAKWISSR